MTRNLLVCALGLLATVGGTACTADAADDAMAEGADTAAVQTDSATRVTKKVDLRAADGTSIHLDYILVTPPHGRGNSATFAEQVVLDLDNPAWRVGNGANRPARVRAVLMSKCSVSGSADETLPYNEQLDVSYNHTVSGMGYELQLATRGRAVNTIPVSKTSAGRKEYCRQEIAVVADGTWIFDEVSHSNNFKFQF